MVESHGWPILPEEAYINQSFDFVSCRAKHLDKTAEYLMAKAYEAGNGVGQNQEQKIRYLKKAARQWNRSTGYFMPSQGDVSGYFVPNTTGVIPGNMKAQYELALLYLGGEEVELKPKKAKRLLEDAAKQDYQPAIDLLARLEAAQAS